MPDIRYTVKSHWLPLNVWPEKQARGNRTSFLGSLFTQNCSAHCSHWQRTYSEQHMTCETQRDPLHSGWRTGRRHNTLRTDCHICIKSFHIPLLCEARQQTLHRGHFSGWSVGSRRTRRHIVIICPSLLIITIQCIYWNERHLCLVHLGGGIPAYEAQNTTVIFTTKQKLGDVKQNEGMWPG